MTGQEFIANNLRMLGLDLNKTFAICSNVPDKELHKLISETFPYHRIWYVDDRISEFYPVGFETGHYPVKED